MTYHDLTTPFKIYGGAAPTLRPCVQTMPRRPGLLRRGAPPDRVQTGNGDGEPAARAHLAKEDLDGRRHRGSPVAHGGDVGIHPGHAGHLVRRSEEHTSELQSRLHLVCRLLLEKKQHNKTPPVTTTSFDQAAFTPSTCIRR